MGHISQVGKSHLWLFDIKVVKCIFSAYRCVATYFLSLSAEADDGGAEWEEGERLRLAAGEWEGLWLTLPPLLYAELRLRRR